MSYPKLVRDKIPELIRERGANPRVRRLDGESLFLYLVEKLREETAEFEESRSAEELADLLEVLRALAEAVGVPFEKVEEERALKFQERGGFRSALLLESIEEPGG